MTTQLMEMVATYAELAAKEKQAKADREAIRDKIITAMATASTTHIEDDILSCDLVAKINIDYKDEKKIIDYLVHSDRGEFVKTSIDKTPFNTQLKKDDALKAALVGLYEEKVVRSLDVKEVKTKK